MSRIIERTVFETPGGQQFNTKAEAEAAHAECEVLRLIYEVVEGYDCSIDISSLKRGELIEALLAWRDAEERSK